jgi:hypothetical protein
LRFEQHAKTCGDKRACRHTDQGARGVFSHYRLRVAGVIRNYGMSERHEQAPKDSASVTRG